MDGYGLHSDMGKTKETGDWLARRLVGVFVASIDIVVCRS